MNKRRTRKPRQVDILREIRRALRALRRAEHSILSAERREDRQHKILQERAELEAIAADARSRGLQ